MAEEFRGVCGDSWWNPNFFSSGGGSCSVAQFGSDYDIGNFGWPHEIMKGKSNNDIICDDNSLIISTDFDSALDILGFSLSPTSTTIDWNQQNQFCKSGGNAENYNSMLEDNLSTTMTNSSNFPSQDGSSPTTMTTSCNNSVDSSTMTCQGGLTTSFPMSSSTSYLIQTLFNDIDDDQSQLINTINYGHEITTSPSACSWSNSSLNNINIDRSPPPPPQFNGGRNNDEQCNNEEALSNIKASCLNSLQSRPRAPSSTPKSLKLKDLQDEVVHNKEPTKNMNNEQPRAKRPRIETPSPLPTFKVPKEKLGDRITALQQLVSPFGKTDTASVLQEAIEYINFLHDQVHEVVSTPYLRNEVVAQHQQVSHKMSNHKDLRSGGLCVVPISSTYPVTQETPVDFWTPTFGGTTLRA